MADHRTAKRNNQPAIEIEHARGKDVESLTSTHGWLVKRGGEGVSRRKQRQNTYAAAGVHAKKGSVTDVTRYYTEDAFKARLEYSSSQSTSIFPSPPRRVRRPRPRPPRLPPRPREYSVWSTPGGATKTWARGSAFRSESDRSFLYSAAISLTVAVRDAFYSRARVFFTFH